MSSRSPWIFVLLCCLNVVTASDGTETLIGIVGKDFVMLGTDSDLSSSIVLTSSKVDKIRVLAEPFPGKFAGSTSKAKRKPQQQQTILAAVSGEIADSDRLIATMRAHSAIREFEASPGCDVHFFNMRRKDFNVVGHDSDKIEASVHREYSEEGGTDNHGLGVSKSTLSACSFLPHLPPGLSVREMAQLARWEIASAMRSMTPYKVKVLIAGMMSQRIQDDMCLNAVRATAQSEAKSMKVATDGKSSKQEPGSKSNKTLSRPIISSEFDGKDEKTMYQSSSSSLQPHLYWLDEYGAIQRIQYGVHGFASNLILSILDRNYRPNLSRKEAALLIQECFKQLRNRFVINTSTSRTVLKCVDASGWNLFETAALSCSEEDQNGSTKATNPRQ